MPTIAEGWPAHGDVVPVGQRRAAIVHPEMVFPVQARWPRGRGHLRLAGDALCLVPAVAAALCVAAQLPVSVSVAQTHTDFSLPSSKPTQVLRETT